MAKKSTLPGKKKTRRKTPSLDVYAERRKLLSQVHDFSFRTRKNFTPQQKAAITRKWKEYRNVVELLEEQRGVFRKAKRSQLKNLKSEDFITTNKGVFVHAGPFKYGRTKSFDVKIKGKGKDTRLEIITASRKEVFVRPKKGENFLQFSKRIIKEKKPKQVLLSVGPYKGLERYDAKLMLRYLEREIDKIIQKYRDEDKEHPFTGLYLVFYR